jgi:hypothetical protein
VSTSKSCDLLHRSIQRAKEYGGVHRPERRAMTMTIVGFSPSATVGRVILTTLTVQIMAYLGFDRILALPMDALTALITATAAIATTATVLDVFQYG